MFKYTFKLTVMQLFTEHHESGTLYSCMLAIARQGAVFASDNELGGKDRFPSGS